MKLFYCFRFPSMLHNAPTITSFYIDMLTGCCTFTFLAVYHRVTTSTTPFTCRSSTAKVFRNTCLCSANVLILARGIVFFALRICKIPFKDSSFQSSSPDDLNHQSTHSSLMPSPLQLSSLRFSWLFTDLGIVFLLIEWRCCIPFIPSSVIE